MDTIKFKGKDASAEIATDPTEYEEMDDDELVAVFLDVYEFLKHADPTNRHYTSAGLEMHVCQLQNEILYRMLTGDLNITA